MFLGYNLPVRFCTKYYIKKEQLSWTNKTRSASAAPPQQMAEAVDEKIHKLKQELDSLAAKRAAANEDFDKKEAAIKKRIAVLEQKKKDIFAPKPPRKPRKTKKQKIQDLIKSASKAGLKPEEIAQRLGLDQPED